MPKFTKVQLAVFLRKKKDEEDMIEAAENAEALEAAEAVDIADAIEADEEAARAARNRAMIHAFHEERKRRIRATYAEQERQERLFFARMDDPSEFPRIQKSKQRARTRYSRLYSPTTINDYDYSKNKNYWKYWK